MESSLSTTQLVNKAMAGDLAQKQWAFAQLIERFQSMTLGCAFAALGDRAQAEDAAQEAWILAWQRLPQLREANAFSAWLRRLVMTCCRRQTRQRCRSTLSLHEIQEDSLPNETGAGTAEQVETDELRFLVRAAVMKLPPKQREVTLLFYLGQNSQAEISEFLGVPLTTVKKRLHDARSRLRKELETMFEQAIQQGANPDLATQAQEVLRSFDNASKERIYELLAQSEKIPGLMEEVMRQGQWQKFTDNARRAIAFASDAAIEQGTTTVEPSHLLFGLRRLQGSFVAQILEDAGMPLPAIPSALETLPVSPATETVLQKAAAQALDLAGECGSHDIEPEHLLLALWEEPQSAAVLDERFVEALSRQIPKLRAHLKKAKSPDSLTEMRSGDDNIGVRR